MIGGNTNFEETRVEGCIQITKGYEFGNTYKGGYHRPDWTISANRNSSIYGNSETVQPLSLKILYLIRF